MVHEFYDGSTVTEGVNLDAPLFWPSLLALVHPKSKTKKELLRESQSGKGRGTASPLLPQNSFPSRLFFLPPDPLGC